MSADPTDLGGAIPPGSPALPDPAPPSGPEVFFRMGPVDAEGFRPWSPHGSGRFIEAYGTIRCRIDADGRARCRVETGRAQSNGMDAIHGGFILAYLDQALFNGAFTLGRLEQGGAVTLSANAQFIAAGIAGEPLDALVEVVGETGRMLFLRGLMVQGDRTVASFDGALRKIGTPRKAGATGP